MKIDITTKFKLIEIFYLSPMELSYLDKLNLSEDIFDDFQGEDLLEVLRFSLKEIMDDENLSEEERLLAACFKRRLQGNVISFKTDGFDDDFDDDEDFDDEDEYDDVEEDYDDLSEEDKEIIKRSNEELKKDYKDSKMKFCKSVPLLKAYSQEEMNNQMFSYIWEQYPQLQKGLDWRIYNTALQSFYEYLGIADRKWQLTQKVRIKIRNADNYARDEIVRRFKNWEIENIDQWCEEYKESMDKLGVKKYTKGNIKEFFDRMNLKVSPIVIDSIQSKLRN